MSSPLTIFLGRLRDPRWVPHISSYCDGRCTRCSFTERCWSYALRQHIEREHSGELSPEEAATQAESEAPHGQGQVERHGTDSNDVDPDASDSRAYEQLEEKIDNDPLVTHARDYGVDVWEIRHPLLQAGDAGPANAPSPADLAEAVENVFGLALTIWAKVRRAVGSLENDEEERVETDPVQNDANGSAKVARLAIVQSLAAWEIIRGVRIMDAGLVEYLVGSLNQIEAELVTRFPLAMAFVRPGFDEEIPGIVRPWSIMPDEDDDEGEADG